MPLIKSNNVFPKADDDDIAMPHARKIHTLEKENCLMKDDFMGAIEFHFFVQPGQSTPSTFSLLMKSAKQPSKVAPV